MKIGQRDKRCRPASRVHDPLEPVPKTQRILLLLIKFHMMRIPIRYSGPENPPSFRIARNGSLSAPSQSPAEDAVQNIEAGRAFSPTNVPASRKNRASEPAWIHRHVPCRDTIIILANGPSRSTSGVALAMFRADGDGPDGQLIPGQQISGESAAASAPAG